MPNRLFYTCKLTSKNIMDENCNYKKSFDDLFKDGKIISLADSQMLKTIRKLTNHKVDLDELETWYEERDRIKKKNNSPENRKKIKELQNNIYSMMYIPEYITVVIENNKDYETFYKNGFLFNGDKYSRFSCSASQARVSTVVFIKDAIKAQAKEILDNGRKMDKPMAPSKYNAYFGLYSSAIKEVKKPRFCIIPDFCEMQKVLVDYVTITDDFSDDIVDERELDLEFNRFDGGGLITHDMAIQWSKDIGIYNPDAEKEEDKGYIACQFCIRQSFAKGMLNDFPILEFCEEKNNGNYIIKDIYGKDVDLREIDVLLTEGMVKLWDSFGYYNDEGEFIPSQEVYEANIEKNEIVWGVTRFTPKEDEKILVTNYQFLQTLKMNDDDIKELCKETVDYLEGVTYDNYWYSLLFMLGVNMTEDKFKKYMKSSDNYWLKTLIANPNMIHDKYTKEKIKDFVLKKIDQACMGKLMVQGNFQVIVPDSYALMEWCCYRDETKVKGLLKAGECYSRFWRDRDKTRILSQRSPLTHFSECHLLDVVWDEEIEKWYRYSYTGFYINTHDDSSMRWAGADFDYDIISSTDNPIMMKCVYKNQKPVTYDIPKPFKKVFTEDDLFYADVQTFGSLIGPLTNRGTSIVSLISEYEQKCQNEHSVDDEKKLQLLQDRLKMVCAAQSRQIDKAKIGKEVKSFPKVWVTYQHIKDDESEHDKKIKEFYNSILCDKKPYFFKHVYKDEKKRFNAYNEENNTTCRLLYRISLKDLINKEDKSEEQEQFIQEYINGNHFINSNCELNRICYHIESINFKIKKEIRDTSHLNMENFYYDDVNFNNETYNLLSEKIKELLNAIRLSEQIKLKDKNIINNDDEDFTNDQITLIKKYKDDMFKNICSSEKEYLNYAVKFFYEDNRTAKKSLFWSLCGEIIYEKTINECGYFVKFPIREYDGNIDFLRNKFSIKTFYLEEEEKNNV